LPGEQLNHIATVLIIQQANVKFGVVEAANDHVFLNLADLPVSYIRRLTNTFRNITGHLQNVLDSCHVVYGLCQNWILFVLTYPHHGWWCFYEMIEQRAVTASEHI